MSKMPNKMEIKYKVSYKKLWKLLIDKGMQKKDLQVKCDISAASIAKLGKDANVTTDLLMKICSGLDCNLSDICETVSIDEH
ncbi:helix-turn-helix domain-containing protein [Ligilactobacillus salivarius]|uniref:helix-turn-helix domain-containing protein n=1 Tax=Ligilactobacillus salivarius TaxID=1624 RepID=UPI0023684DC3|nr:helix-turn-helix transcriptional regulator [Ligilactobacillus salivarius]